MARNIDWLSIEGAYRAGVMPLREIGDTYGVSEAAIRKKAKLNDWLRDPTGTKREIVKGLIAGITTGSTQQSAQEYAKRTIYTEADKDAEYMGDCLDVAVKAVHKLHAMIDSAEEPKDIKIIVDANKSAMDTIRRIRGLDDASGTPSTSAADAMLELAKSLPR